MKAKCFLCGEKTARRIVARSVPDKTGTVFLYTQAYKGPAFCSKLCAMNYGLISIKCVIEPNDSNEGSGWAWDEKQNAWKPLSSDGE